MCVCVSMKALQAQALQLMALGVAGAQTVVPVSGSPVLLTMPNATQCGTVKPTIPVGAAMPAAQLQPTQTTQLPTVLTSTPPILPKITTSLTTPTPTSVTAPPLPLSQDSINKQQLMEQLANSVTKNGGNGQQDSDINEELVEFMKWESFIVITVVIIHHCIIVIILCGQTTALKVCVCSMPTFSHDFVLICALPRILNWYYFHTYKQIHALREWNDISRVIL